MEVSTFNPLVSGPESFLINGKIQATVASNNLTVAIKTIAGTDPSPANPVSCRINDTIRQITSALSVTVNAGTNWFNAGSSELATLEIDYFVYLGHNATDGVTVGFSRIVANQYSDFSATNTNEKYAAISTITNAASTDHYELIGRFAATLSAGAGYTWTVPTFTAINLIQRPVYESRWLSWNPVFTGFSADPTGLYSKYKVTFQTIQFRHNEATNGTSNATTFTLTFPFASNATTGSGMAALIRYVNNGAATLAATPGLLTLGANSNTASLFIDLAGGVWTNVNGKRATGLMGFYEI